MVDSYQPLYQLVEICYGHLKQGAFMKKVLILTLTTTVLFSAAASSAGTQTALQAPAAQQPAPVADSFSQALLKGKPLFDARYRFEFVDQDGLADEANAHTIRTRFGYETMKFHNITALVEVENISDIGGERYNDTINGKTTYPTVGDIEGTDLNRAYIAYFGIPQTNVMLGRQNIALDNQRWVGAVGWRQNDQTFDAITVSNTSIPNTSVFYAHSNQVNKTLGYRSPAGIWDDANINLVNLGYTGFPVGKISAYSYLVDTPDSKTTSSETYGARFDGKQAVTDVLSALYALEYATQSDYGSNTANYNVDYFSVEPGVTIGQFTVKAQYENIEGNGTQALQFPLATLHAFNGWADKLTTIPANGLVDKNIGIIYVAKSENEYLNGTKAQVFYHDYSPENGSGADYGTEWNASVEQLIKGKYTVGIKYANYHADSFATDTVKIMPYIQYKF